MRAIITRQDALASGLKRYFTGKPCKRGHVAERNALSCFCMECSRENERTLPRHYRRDLLRNDVIQTS